MNGRRRALLAAVSGLAFLASARGARSQTGAGKRRVAYFSYSSPAAGGRFLAQFTAGLRELGWIEGSNLMLDVRWAQGDAARYAPLTSELLALRPDVFVASIDYAVLAAADATKTVPIVFINGTDPVGRGLVQSLQRPGGNVTGFATQDSELFPKRLALLKEAIPRLKKVGVFTSSQDRLGLDALEDARRKLDLEFVPAVIDRPEDIDAAFDKFARAGVTGVLDYAAGATTLMARERVAALAIQHRMAMFGLPVVADSGVLLAWGYDIPALFKRAATLVDRILKGAKPADIPVEQVDVFELVVNLRTARALGIELPRSLMLQATRVIE
ncbi:MAG TPA: ABC transporter substrate-binding protein [Burkholderiaceae bacterium]|jgi:putative ABC transport system substrate-binding protein